MREPVLFHKAIDGIFAAETVPDVVLEIGPHQTLVSPIKQVRSRAFVCLRSSLDNEQNALPILNLKQQILNGSGKAAAVLPTLKKGAPCSRRFFEALGKLFELGVQVMNERSLHMLLRVYALPLFVKSFQAPINPTPHKN